MRYDKKVIAVQWHITDKCQKKCRHCYVGKRNVREMELVNIEQIVSDLIKYGTNNDVDYEFYITGGDPLLHKNCYDVFSLFKENKLSYSIMCNPEAIDTVVIDKLSKLDVKSIQFSIDGMEKTHDNIRGNGSFKELMRAIDQVKMADIKIGLMFTLYEFNINDLFEVMHLANCLQVDRFSFDIGIGIGNAKENCLKMVSPSQIIQILNDYIVEKQLIKEKGTKTFFEEKCNLINAIRMEQGIFSCPQEENIIIFDGCQMGVNNFVIDVNGDVLGCRRLGEASYCGNLLETGIEQIWKCSSFLKKQRTKVLTKNNCKDCDARNWCQGCEAYEHAAADKENNVLQPLCGNLLSISCGKKQEVNKKEKGNVINKFVMQDCNTALIKKMEFKKAYIYILLNKNHQKELLNNYIEYAQDNNLDIELCRWLYYLFVNRYKM